MHLLLLALPAAAQLPDLRIEPTAGGSIFHIKNTAAQPLTGWLIELVDYPGSSYSLWQDDLAAPLAPGTEKRIPVANMTVGAVPDYVKMQAAVYADGTTAGVPEKVTSLIERRRHILQTTRDLIRRFETIPPTALTAELQSWITSLQPGRRMTQEGINQSAARGVIQEALTKLNSSPRADVLAGLKVSERRLASSKPAL
jgi:hypothetical protein